MKINVTLYRRKFIDVNLNIIHHIGILSEELVDIIELYESDSICYVSSYLAQISEINEGNLND